MIQMLVRCAFALLLGAPLLAGTEDDFPSQAPSVQAPAHKRFQHVAKNGLRYVWWVPKGYDGTTPCNLTVICHGTGLDYRWGAWNNPVGDFRPDDIVVSVDGPSPGEGDTQLFLGEKKDATAFAAFLAEMRESFAVDRIFLYGHSQGGFFVIYFAGEHPELVTGVVAHASGAWNWSKMTTPVKRIAIAFMHGTQDPVVPYGQSPGSRDAYANEGFELLFLRRLEGYNHWPNAVRASECVDWCEGITSTAPEEALECAKRLLRPKRPDQYKYETAVAFCGARAVLRRFEGKGALPFKDVPPEVVSEAAELSKRIEDAGAEHVDALKAKVAKKSDLKLDGGAWLGHLLPLREDFRGVDSVEAYLKAIDFDKVRASQEKAASDIFSAWHSGGEPKKIFETVTTKIGSAFLVEGFPPELVKKMEEWKRRANDLGIKDKPIKQFAEFEDWTKARQNGREEYARLWKTWKAP